MKEKLLIALGGNALLRAGEKGTAGEQLLRVHETAGYFLELVQEGYQLAITHGNGPQVGAILLQNEIAKDKLPAMPLDICGAESQGLIGYMLVRQMFSRFKMAKVNKEIVCLVTQTLVDKNDAAFKNPTKPIGPFYNESQANVLKEEKKWQMVFQTGKGFRRVVPSPEPIDIIEGPIVEELFQRGKIVIACGGGGIPVIQESDGSLKGIEAVIDKDHTAAVLAQKIKADILLILTDVEAVAVNFGKPNQKNLSRLSLADAKKYLKAGEFGQGSMGPKVEAAMQFISKGGKKAIITSLEKAKDALLGKSGTAIVN